MTPTPRRWTVRCADVTFDCTAGPEWACDQQRYLADYLPDEGTHRQLARFRLSIHPEKASYQDILEDISTGAAANRLEPVPGMVVLEHHTADGDRCYAIRPRGDAAGTGFAVRARRRTLELFLPGEMAAMRRYPLRIMREAMLRVHEDHGGVVFHAAGADVAGRGIMICGPRSAGKTTVLTCLLRTTGARLLSNDRLIVEGQRRLLAVPLPVALARGTLEAFPELTRAPHAFGRPHTPLDGLPKQFGTPAKRDMSPRGYASALNCTIAPDAQLGAVLVPRLSQGAEPLRIRALPPAASRKLLSTSCFTPYDEFWQQPWLLPRAIPDVVLAERAERLTRALAENLPCLEIRFGIHNPLTYLENLLHNVLDNLEPGPI